MSMATALCLDVAVHDMLSLQTTDIGDFLLFITRINKFFSVLESINSFYKSNDSVLMFDEFTPEDLKLLVQSENITYAAIQKIYDMIPVDRSNVSVTWTRVSMIRRKESDDTDNTQYGPDYIMRTQYAFSGMIMAAVKYQGTAFNNYAFSKSSADIDSDIGDSDGPVFNLDFASKADLLWITDTNCLESAFSWLYTIINAKDVNLRGCALAATTDLMRKYDIVSMLRTIGSMMDYEITDEKWKLTLSRLMSMREKILNHVCMISDFLLSLLEKDKLTDVDSLRLGIDFLLQYGGLVSKDRALAFSKSKGIFEYVDCRLQNLLLQKAAESAESAAERAVRHSLLF